MPFPRLKAFLIVNCVEKKHRRHRDQKTRKSRARDAYPELVADQFRLEETLQIEGERFADTLEQGIRMLDREISNLSGSVLAGDVAFRLYDTYGFPVDLTADYCREKGLTVDMNSFEQAMSKQRARARAASCNAPRLVRLEVETRAQARGVLAVSYTHLTLPTICSV